MTDFFYFLTFYAVGQNDGEQKSLARPLLSSCVWGGLTMWPPPSWGSGCSPEQSPLSPGLKHQFFPGQSVVQWKERDMMSQMRSYFIQIWGTGRPVHSISAFILLELLSHTMHHRKHRPHWPFSYLRHPLDTVLTDTPNLLATTRIDVPSWMSCTTQATSVGCKKWPKHQQERMRTEKWSQ